MVPALTKGGSSFKGAAAYYLHDKPAPGQGAGREERPTSSNRVAWTETVNLTTADPDRAWRMMATTAMAQAELKAAAGVKATGRKLTSPVFAYSLAWHPDERPDRTEQMDAARSSLKALGLEEHQAVIVAHNDEPHAHVHVIVNRVHPADGKAATLSNSQRAIQKWALAYERQQGKILCPKREENAKKREQGQQVNAPREARQIHEARKGTGNDNLAHIFVRSDQTQKDAALAERGRAMHDRHGRQWDAIRTAYQDARRALYGHGDARKTKAAERVKEAHSPDWRSLFERQRREKEEFERREQSPLGRVRNIADAIKEAGWQQGTAKGVLGAVFGMASGQARAVLETRQESERKALSQAVQASTFTATASVRRDVKADLDRLRGDFVTRCDTLRTEQAEERGALREAWRERDAERTAAYAGITGRGTEQAQEREATQPAQEQGRGFEQDGGMEMDFGPG